MTLKELHERLVLMLTEVPEAEDFEVKVHAMTGRLSNDSKVAVKDISWGIDWDSKRILIHPAETLVLATMWQKEKEKNRMVGAARGAKDESSTHDNH